MLTNKNINTLVFCLKWNYTRENQPRLTLAAAYIRHKMNRLNVYGSHKMQIACINGSGLSFRPDWSNDDIVCFGNNGSRGQKRETIGFGQENCGNLHKMFVSDQSSGLKEMC